MNKLEIIIIVLVCGCGIIAYFISLARNFSVMNARAASRERKYSEKIYEFYRNIYIQMSAVSFAIVVPVVIFLGNNYFSERLEQKNVLQNLGQVAHYRIIQYDEIFKKLHQRFTMFWSVFPDGLNQGSQEALDLSLKPSGMKSNELRERIGLLLNDEIFVQALREWVEISSFSQQVFFISRLNRGSHKRFANYWLVHDQSVRLLVNGISEFGHKEFISRRSVSEDMSNNTDRHNFTLNDLDAARVFFSYREDIYMNIRKTMLIMCYAESIGLNGISGTGFFVDMDIIEKDTPTGLTFAAKVKDLAQPLTGCASIFPSK